MILLQFRIEDFLLHAMEKHRHRATQRAHQDRRKSRGKIPKRPPCETQLRLPLCLRHTGLRTLL
jgi:hypothetical protein